MMVEMVCECEGRLSSVENACEGGRRQATKRIGRKELFPDSTLDLLSMSPWTLGCILRGEVAWLCLSQHTTRLQSDFTWAQDIPDTSSSHWRASCASSCWVKVKAVLLLVVDSVLYFHSLHDVRLLLLVYLSAILSLVGTGVASSRQFCS